MGVELLVGLVAGFMILGPRRMHSMMGTLGQAKAHFDKAKRELTAQLAAGVKTPPKAGRLEIPANLPVGLPEKDNS